MDMFEENEATFGVYLAHPDAKFPVKNTKNDAGFDICSVEDANLMAGHRKVVSTGVHLKMYAGWECQVRPRSGNAAKLGITIVNTPGTVDADYTGEIKVILLNTSDELVKLPKGSKIAQLVFKRVANIVLFKINEMPTNEIRGANGMGSSDKKS